MRRVAMEVRSAGKARQCSDLETWRYRYGGLEARRRYGDTDVWSDAALEARYKRGDVKVCRYVVLEARFGRIDAEA